RTEPVDPGSWYLLMGVYSVEFVGFAVPARWIRGSGGWQGSGSCHSPPLHDRAGPRSDSASARVLRVFFHGWWLRHQPVHTTCRSDDLSRAATCAILSA